MDASLTAAYRFLTAWDPKGSTPRAPPPPSPSGDMRRSYCRRAGRCDPSDPSSKCSTEMVRLSIRHRFRSDERRASTRRRAEGSSVSKGARARPDAVGAVTFPTGGATAPTRTTSWMYTGVFARDRMESNVSDTTVSWRDNSPTVREGSSNITSRIHEGRRLWCLSSQSAERISSSPFLSPSSPNPTEASPTRPPGTATNLARRWNEDKAASGASSPSALDCDGQDIRPTLPSPRGGAATGTAKGLTAEEGDGSTESDGTRGWWWDDGAWMVPSSKDPGASNARPVKTSRKASNMWEWIRRPRPLPAEGLGGGTAAEAEEAEVEAEVEAAWGRVGGRMTLSTI
mmetsp:Transcript_25034/g.49793  ORF Transcript_25034/g.49793 Transcript_25034/m.49793 type:complete len:343 (-) Transcript_25034:92-1120(-)